MARMIKHSIVVITTLLVSMPFAAGIPISSLTPSSFGIEYTGFVAGQTITEATVPSVLNAQYLTLRYSPIDYLLVSFGVGGTRFTTAEYESARFMGRTGISVNGGIGLYSPRFFDMLLVTGGIEGYLLNSSRDDYRYTAGLANPYLGFIVLLGTIVDIQAGLKAQFIYGTMADPLGREGVAFSNTTYPRGYAAVTLHSPGGNAYATLGFDASREIGSEWADGPQEASFSLQIGFIVRELMPEKQHAPDSKSGKDSNYDKMKEKQDKMAEEMRK